ncbi:hypothetical protein L8106_13240 [Lyngbya sp. PCC 8106]|nr:hypothetical protein L8106_13240 [Lyngbya sp. PCC 8106]
MILYWYLTAKREKRYEKTKEKLFGYSDLFGAFQYSFINKKRFGKF